MHVAIDHGLQHISSNRKQSINSYFKDLALNYAVLQYIEHRSSGRTIDGTGFEDNQKRYDDLKELKRINIGISTYKQNGIDEVFVIQPNDYYKLIGSTSYVLYNKSKETHTYNSDSIKYKVLNFPNDYNTGETYANFKITRDGVDIIDIGDYENFPSTFGHESKFMYVNLVLNKLVDFHWERWDDSILYDSFIIIDDDDAVDYELTYTSNGTPISRTSSNETIVVNKFDEPIDTVYKKRRNELLSSLYIENIEENVQYNRNRHRKPLSKLIQNRIIIEQGEDFLIPFVDIEYLIKPTLIDYVTGKTCEISITREIVDLAIQRLKAYMKDEGYQHVVHETQISE